MFMRKGQINITFSLFLSRIGIVNHHLGLGLIAQLQEFLLAVAGFEQIKADPHMAIEKVLLVKGGFSGALNTDENNGLHLV